MVAAAVFFWAGMLKWMHADLQELQVSLTLTTLRILGAKVRKYGELHTVDWDFTRFVISLWRSGFVP